MPLGCAIIILNKNGRIHFSDLRYKAGRLCGNVVRFLIRGQLMIFFLISILHGVYTLMPDTRMEWCLDLITSNLAAKNISVANYVTYDYQENYSNQILACPQFDIKIDSSRVYWLLALPHVAREDPCSFVSGDVVDVLLLHFDGVDSKELMLHTMEPLSMRVTSFCLHIVLCFVFSFCRLHQLGLLLRCECPLRAFHPLCVRACV